jgi:hypothetical protein
MNATVDPDLCAVDPGSPVDTDVAPDWFRRRLLNALGWKDDSTDGYSLCRDVAYRFCRSTLWFDHCGTAVVDGQPVFACEPFLKLGDDFSDAREFADLCDCHLVVDEKSHRRPGRTVRLAFISTYNAALN